MHGVKAVASRKMPGKLRKEGGRRVRRVRGRVLLSLCFSRVPLAWRAVALLTQRCLQPEGNFSDRRHEEFYFPF